MEDQNKQIEELSAAQASYFQLSCDLAAAQRDAELWRHAIKKGVVTVHSERIHDRDPNTLCSWIQGHDKAADVSNEYAAIDAAMLAQQVAGNVD